MRGGGFAWRAASVGGRNIGGMTQHFGKPMSLYDITVDDVTTHPIWVWAWEAGKEEEAEDETCQCPVIGTDDVGTGFTEPIITFRVKDTAIIGSGRYDAATERLEGMALWQVDTWTDLCDAGIAAPVVLVAVPTIRGVADVEFICGDLASDEAARAK